MERVKEGGGVFHFIFHFWLSPHFPRGQNTKKSRSLLPNPTETLATQASMSVAYENQALLSRGLPCNKSARSDKTL